jgi:hypothetical protein
MATMNEIPLERFSSRDARRLLRNLLGGALIVLVWFALWAWIAAGVVSPLSAVPRLAAEPRAAASAI